MYKFLLLSFYCINSFKTDIGIGKNIATKINHLTSIIFHANITSQIAKKDKIKTSYFLIYNRKTPKISSNFTEIKHIVGIKHIIFKFNKIKFFMGTGLKIYTCNHKAKVKVPLILQIVYTLKNWNVYFTFVLHTIAMHSTIKRDPNFKPNDQDDPENVMQSHNKFNNYGEIIFSITYTNFNSSNFNFR